MMKNLLKQAVAAGINAVKKDEHLKKVVTDAVKNRKINTEEGTKVLSNLKKRVSQSTEEWKEVADNSAKKYLEKMDLVKRSEMQQTVDRLEERMKQLEARVVNLEKQLNQGSES